MSEMQKLLEETCGRESLPINLGKDCEKRTATVPVGGYCKPRHETLPGYYVDNVQIWYTVHPDGRKEWTVQNYLVDSFSAEELPDALLAAEKRLRVALQKIGELCARGDYTRRLLNGK